MTPVSPYFCNSANRLSYKPPFRHSLIVTINDRNIAYINITIVDLPKYRLSDSWCSCDPGSISINYSFNEDGFVLVHGSNGRIQSILDKVPGMPSVSGGRAVY